MGYQIKIWYMLAIKDSEFIFWVYILQIFTSKLAKKMYIYIYKTLYILWRKQIDSIDFFSPRNVLKCFFSLPVGLLVLSINLTELCYIYEYKIFPLINSFTYNIKMHIYL